MYHIVHTHRGGSSWKLGGGCAGGRAAKRAAAGVRGRSPRQLGGPGGRALAPRKPEHFLRLKSKNMQFQIWKFWNFMRLAVFRTCFLWYYTGINYLHCTLFVICAVILVLHRDVAREGLWDEPKAKLFPNFYLFSKKSSPPFLSTVSSVSWILLKCQYSFTSVLNI